MGAVVVALGLFAACNDAAKHGEHAPAKSATEKTPAKDPHAGHAMPPATGAGTYDLVLSVESPAPGVKTRLAFDPRSGSERIEKLAIVHEKPLHLLVVSRDLSFFAHEHPERQSDGTYALDFAFPTAGDYVMFGDFRPEGAEGQIVRIPVTVAGDAPPPRPLLAEDRAKAKAFGASTVALAPASIVAGADTMLAFTIERGGKPVTDLRPYLGALGHCVVIDETATRFLHSHPQDAGAPSNVVQFHTVFPDPGKYKVWGQFDVGGEMLVADYVVEVAPAGVAVPADPHAGHPH
jgi:hypothetical protein